MISAVRAANVILGHAAQDGEPLTPLQVMKLVYMSHGVNLAKFDAPLIPDPVQAWQYGPVVSSLYGAMKHFGNRPIHPPKLTTTMFDRSEPTDGDLWALGAVYKAYGKLTGPALSNLTHRPGSPWSRIWRPGVSNLVIPNELIAQHYKEARAKGVLDAA
jgi:uncharacterized phage-associated protein